MPGHAASTWWLPAVPSARTIDPGTKRRASDRARENDVAPHEQVLEPPSCEAVQQPRLAPGPDRRLHALDAVTGLVEQLLDRAPGEEAQMRGVEHPRLRVLPATTEEVDDVAP